MYLIIIDRWNVEISNDKFTIDMAQNIIEKPKGNGLRWSTAVGSLLIQRCQIHVWKLKILSEKPDIIIGIIDDQGSKEYDVSALFTGQGSGCGIYTENGKLYSAKFSKYISGQYSTKAMKQNDIVFMTLDITNDENYATLCSWI